MFDAESCIQPDTESQLLLLGRYTNGQGWTATTEARLKADLAEGLGTAAIAKKHGWHVVSAQRAIRKVRSGASLLTKEKHSKITETVSNYIRK